MLNMNIALTTINCGKRWSRKTRGLTGSLFLPSASTGVYCRPSCPSRRAHRERVKFFDLPEAAEQAGFRACLRCQPQRARVLDPQIELVQRVCRLLNSNEGETVETRRARLASRRERRFICNARSNA